MYNLLTHKIFRVRAVGRRTDVFGLPQVIAELAADRIESFSVLSAHQVRAFLVQLVAMVQETAMSDYAEHRRCLLTELAAGETPWHLANDAIGSPVFLQPPIARDVQETECKRIARDYYRTESNTRQNNDTTED